MEDKRSEPRSTVGVIGIIVLAAIVILAAGCSSGGGDDSGGGGGSFTQITGSGYLTVRLLNANTAHGGKTFMCGAGGIKWGPSERVGSGTPIDSNDMSVVIHDQGEPDFLFAGGRPVGIIGGIIDVNGSNEVDDGDYVAAVQNYTVNGNATITFAY